MEKKVNNYQLINLIKYDYRYFYFFNNEMKFYKEQFIQKYNNKNKYQIYLITKEKYIKRIKKKKYYENLYLKNKYVYYFIFTEKVMSKYIRKQLYKDLFSLLKSILINLLLEYFGIKKKLKKLLPF